MVIPESHILKKKTAVVSVIPNRYYFKNVFFVAVIPKLYFQHRITFKLPIVVAVIPIRFSSSIMFFVGFIPKWYFHVRFPFRTEQKKTIVVAVIPTRYYFQTRGSGPTMVFPIKSCPCW